MQQFLKYCIQNQRFQDTAGIIRGVYRVASSNNSQLLQNNQQQSSKNQQQQIEKEIQTKNQFNQKQEIDKIEKSQNIQKQENIQNNQNQKQEIDKIEKSQNIQKEENPYFKQKQENDKIEKSQNIQKEELQINESDFLENKVPSSQIQRVWNFTKLGASIFSSSAIDIIKSKLKNEDKNIKEIVLNEKNADKLSKSFCKLRGAPLKLAQMLSIQEEDLIPKEIRQQFEKARNQAYMMPKKQLDQMLKSQLGNDWRQKFQKFDEVPIAAASIGQVHQAIDINGKKVAVKIQYPGVNESIDSDLDNLLFVMKLSNVFPKQMYLDKLIYNTRLELKEECNYKLEALKQIKFRSNFQKYQEFNIPDVKQQLSNERIITTDFIDGHSIDYIAENYSQEERNRVGQYLMKLTLTELFKYRFMQTDPNPANYFFNQEKQQLNLIDYGAAREFDKQFIDNYIQIIHGAAHQDKKKVYSKNVGFLTGDENIQMKEAHCDSVIAVGTPFSQNNNFDFGTQDMTKLVYKKVPIMLKNRLKPPPQEVYSLHRKLSGTFLINMKIRASYDSRKIFMDLYDNYKFD